MNLQGKHIILGITGGIAAYKCATLTRLLVKEGAEVKVMMTEAAKHFITPLTMATLSRNPILVEFFDPENGAWNSHVSLGEWADLFLVAPATANTLAKMATGVADNLLLTTSLSARCPIMVAPAMDLEMCKHPSVEGNLSTLRSRGVMVVEPEKGELASGLSGRGRMAEPETIVERIVSFFSLAGSWSGKRVLITAGPTYEKIDPVRFVGNFSSGKMGFALAEAAAARGAEVTLIAGPVSLSVHHPAIHRMDVVSADEMYDAVMGEKEGADVLILCAAVADYKPSEVSAQKIKRTGENLSLALTPNRDIAAAVGSTKKPHQVLVTFALESEHGEENALAKMEKKHADLMVLNSLEEAGAGFGVDTNRVTIFCGDGNRTEVPLKLKREVADIILTKIESYL